jgi:uncharacterized membrane protein YciS (DUF1049 family)
MNGFKWFLGLCSVLMVFVLAAVAVNQQELTLSFALWQTPFALSMFWWLLAAFLLGLFFGALTLLWVSGKYRFRERQLRRDLEKANADLARCRGEIAPSIK